jgi:hypothetical protein
VKPYYQDSAVTIYHGDGMVIAPMVATSDCAIVTDPPFGFGFYAHDIAPCHKFFRWAMRNCAALAVFGYPENLCALCGQIGQPDEWVTWWPTNLFGRSRLLMRTSQAIAVFGKNLSADKITEPRSENPLGRAVAITRGNDPDNKRAGDVWRDFSPCSGARKTARQQHPNEKPTTLMRKLILLCNCATVIDPFCGSGSTLVAARELGLKSVGVEINKEHVETCKRRLTERLVW